MTVPFTVSGTANNPADFGVSASPVMILAGQLSANVTISPAEDLLDELDETVILTLGAPTNAGLGVITAHTATITDNDAAPTVAFALATQNVSEGTASTTATISLSAVSSLDVTVPFTVSGTANNPADFGVSASPVMILAGQLSANVTISPAEDLLDELDETVVLTLGTPTNAGLGATTAHTATITDNDAAPTVAFAAPTQSVSEGTASTTVTISLSSASSLDVTVPFTVSGTANNPADFSVSASPVMILAGQLSANVTISPAEDLLDEVDETVILTLGAPTNAGLGVVSAHTATITDNDAAPTVAFTLATQNVSEGTASTMATISLSALSSQDVTVPFTVTGTATDPADFGVSASPVLILAGQMSADVTISPAEDLLDELDETVILTLGAPVNAGLGVVSAHTATITDNDAAPTVAFTLATQNVSEGTASTTATISLSAPSSKDVTVPFTVSGTATDPADFSVSASPVMILAGQMSADVTISPAEDLLDELDETVVLTLGAPTNAGLGATTAHTATITDNDAEPTVAFTAPTQDVDEAGAPVTATVLLSGVSGLDVSIPFTVGGTATNPDDYGISVSPLTIIAGQLSVDITLTPVDDLDSEVDETVEITLGVPTGATLGATTLHTATIQDDDGGGALAVLDSGGITGAAEFGEPAAIAVPFDVFDADAEAVRVVVQWKRTGESFAELPTSVEALTSLLDDPLRTGERAARQIATELPLSYGGSASVLGLSSDEVELPELDDSARQLLKRGVLGRSLEFLRTSDVFQPSGWEANSLASPMGVTVSRDGRTAFVLEADVDGWRVRELELATGTVLALVAAGDGDPRALAVSAAGTHLFIASSTRVFRLDLRVLQVASVAHGFADGPRALAVLDDDSVIATGDDALVHFDLSAGSARTVLVGLAAPWGVVADPADSARMYVAEQGRDRILAVDVGFGTAFPLELTGALLRSPRALALEDGGGRLLVVTEDGAGAAFVGAFELARSDALELASLSVAPPELELGAAVTDAQAVLATGADNLVVVLLPTAEELHAKGGVEQRRTIRGHDPVTHVVRADAVFDPPISDGGLWRVRAPLGVVETDAKGRRHVFLWDSGDVLGGGLIELRVIPIHSTIGDWIADMPPLRIGPSAPPALVVGRR